MTLKNKKKLIVNHLRMIKKNIETRKVFQILIAALNKA